jgi:GNAT superfamily N-acetyltransferase
VELLRFSELDDAQLARARAIYEDSFPAALRSPFDSLLTDRCYAYVAENGSTVGLAVLRELTSGEWFLRYFVVGERGQGLGSRLWRAVAEELGTRIVLDVEHPDEPGIDAEEEHERRRRVVFYERLGVAVLPVRDYTPPHDAEAPPMLLLSSDPPTEPADVRRVVETVYRDRYGLDADDPVVRRTLAASGLT